MSLSNYKYILYLQLDDDDDLGPGLGPYNDPDSDDDGPHFKPHNRKARLADVETY